MPVDGHFMHLAGGRGVYAATRAWHWQHGFKEVVLAVADAKQAFANAATEAEQEAAAAEARGGGNQGNPAEVVVKICGRMWMLEGSKLLGKDVMQQTS